MVDMYDHPSQFEPLLISSDRPLYRNLISLAEELIESSVKLDSLIPKQTASGLYGLVDGMNCYYSNLIEGHHTRPADIERALHQDFSGDKKQQDMQHLAAAHITTGRWARNVDLLDIGIVQFTREAHRKFYSSLPTSMLSLENGISIAPGEFRCNEVAVGRHIPPRHDAIRGFLSRYESVYDGLLRKAGSGGLNKLEAVLGSMIAHHRMVWVHPFLDGNGRVSRIILDAMLKASGVSSAGLWSMSRGFAKADVKYKANLAGADEPRMGDLDGRGNLSEQKLSDFCEFSIETAKDQIDFMTHMFSVDQIEQRCWNYFNVTQNNIRPEAARLYLHAFQRGEFERGEAGLLTGLAERTARDVLRDMVQAGFLVSDSPKGKVRAGFPMCALGSLFPNLYPAGDMDMANPNGSAESVSRLFRAPHKSRMNARLKRR